MSKMISGKKLKIIICTVLLVLLAAGCGKEARATDRVEIRKNGQIRVYSYADFPADRYDLPSLEKEAQEAVDSYNETAGEKRITLKSISAGGGTAECVLYYKGGEDYTAFNGRFLYAGTIDEALGSGAADGSTAMRMADGSGKTTIGRFLQETPADDIDRYAILVLEDAAMVEHYGEAVCFSTNCNLEADGTVDAHPEPDSEMKRACIIYRIK